MGVLDVVPDGVGVLVAVPDGVGVLVAPDGMGALLLYLMVWAPCCCT